MKKHIFLSVFILTLSIAFTSCKKHKQGTVTYQTIEVNLDASKSYQYDFGTGKQDLSITKQSTSFVVSEIDKLNENNVFSYMAKLNTTSDVVEVTLFEEEEHGGHHGHGHHGGNGNCQGHHDGNTESKHHDDDDDRTVYTFKFNIHTVATTSTTKAIEETVQK